MQCNESLLDYSKFDGISDEQSSTAEMEAFTRSLAENDIDTSGMDLDTRERYEDMRLKARIALLEGEIARRRSTWDARKRTMPLCCGTLSVEMWLKYEDWKKPQCSGGIDAFRINQGNKNPNSSEATCPCQETVRSSPLPTPIGSLRKTMNSRCPAFNGATTQQSRTNTHATTPDRHRRMY